MSAFRQNPTVQRLLASIVILVCALGGPIWPVRATPPEAPRSAAPLRAAGVADGLLQAPSCPVGPAPRPTAPAAMHRGLDRVYRLVMIGPAVLGVTRNYLRDLKAVLFLHDGPPEVAAREVPAAGPRESPDASSTASG